MMNCAGEQRTRHDQIGVEEHKIYSIERLQVSTNHDWLME